MKTAKRLLTTHLTLIKCLLINYLIIRIIKTHTLNGNYIQLTTSGFLQNSVSYTGKRHSLTQSIDRLNRSHVLLNNYGNIDQIIIHSLSLDLAGLIIIKTGKFIYLLTVIIKINCVDNASPLSVVISCNLLLKHYVTEIRGSKNLITLFNR